MIKWLQHNVIKIFAVLECKHPKFVFCLAIFLPTVYKHRCWKLQKMYELARNGVWLKSVGLQKQTSDYFKHEPKAYDVMKERQDNLLPLDQLACSRIFGLAQTCTRWRTQNSDCFLPIAWFLTLFKKMDSWFLRIKNTEHNHRVACQI